ncbi:RsmB/NOP family class I SAM-dependent RNA methyltransferase [Sphingomonas xanthus]|uniref:RsmB/NOP family class I SAM-dependent RNA methyltransferase n=1 Tax=Sphingomonas xanthus TaxID=2594473 RepID=A0A516IRJ8_9SPHN|nr:RsmB/NOP family class I SAM-dependent RNA methyltransferase [Sphingomonas xanthus]QDP19518.1 RsmB/NOP family class I SAM-dependent RNA methyltransferase [Sphingomonas xanthus]
MPSTEGLEPRKAALRMLDAILRRAQTMDNAAQIARSLPPADAALATAIAGETLRRLPDLDFLIDSATRQCLPDDAKARMVLRIALAQKIGLGTPDHAVVATALPLVDGGPRRLVHGVLGTLLRRGLPAIEAPRLPAEVEARWSAAWGSAVVAAARDAIARRPATDLSFASAPACAEFTQGVSLAPLHRRLDPGSMITELPGFAEGHWWVQDLAASLPARLVPLTAQRVLDACAAPGGKTMQLAARGHAVTALDRSESRLARLSENLSRTGLAAETVTADALHWDAPEPFDAVLLDAPCSATGTFRRHPEVLYRARPAIIADSAALQSSMLDRASAWVRPGGSLVYAVCSLEPEEGELQIAAFLGRNPHFALQPAVLLPDGVTPSAEGWVRVLPGMLADEGGLDGFFVAHLVRSAA